MAPTPPAVVVRSSSIDGLGVFAVQAFAPGDVVLAIDDSRIVNDDHPLPSAAGQRHCDYLEAGKIVLMPAPERHINHSCDPNVYVRTIDGVRLVIARTPIAVDEEIAYDYCIDSSGDVVWNSNCGASRCRRAIHSGFFHLPLELQRERLPLLDGWFRRERSVDIAKLQTSTGWPAADSLFPNHRTASSLRT